MTTKEIEQTVAQILREYRKPLAVPDLRRLTGYRWSGQQIHMACRFSYRIDVEHNGGKRAIYILNE